MTFHVERIDHVVLRVRDQPAMVRFYEQALGFKVERRLDRISLVQLRAGGTNEILRFAEIEDDGSYQFNYVPPGTYTLQVIANDLNDPSVNGPLIRQSYKTAKLPVIVMEHDVVLDDVLLPALKPGEKPETE